MTGASGQPPVFNIPWDHPDTQSKHDENWRALIRMLTNKDLFPGVLPNVYAEVLIEKNKGGVPDDTSTLTSDFQQRPGNGGPYPGWMEQGPTSHVDIKLGGITWDSSIGGWRIPIDGYYLANFYFEIEGTHTGGIDKYMLAGALGGFTDLLPFMTIPNTKGGSNIIPSYHVMSAGHLLAGNGVGPAIWNRTGDTIVLRICRWDCRLVTFYPDGLAYT